MNDEFFPYKHWLKYVCQQYPAEVHIFYQKTWKRRTVRSFFNFYKIIILSGNEKLAEECHAIEALNRYLSSMFYAISCSSIIIMLVLIFSDFSCYEYEQQLKSTLITILILYLIAAGLILRNYRYIRAKEVEKYLQQPMPSEKNLNNKTK